MNPLSLRILTLITSGKSGSVFFLSADEQLLVKTIRQTGFQLRSPTYPLLNTFRHPGKSGSVFFLSADEQLLVKTIRKTEFQLLQRLLPRYYGHMQSHPNSLLVRVLGLYSITAASSGGRKVSRASR